MDDWVCMNNRSTSRTREHIVLALELYRRIPHRHKVTSKELKEQLETVGIIRDIRTIQRNLDLLTDSFDVEKDDRNKPYGYYRLSPKPLSIGALEALLISLAEENLSYLLPSNLNRTLKSLFRDARYYLSPNDHNGKERGWLKKVRLVHPGNHEQPAGISKEVLEKVSHGLFHNRWLTLHIANKTDSLVAIDAMPLGLIQKGIQLFLVCKCNAEMDTVCFDLEHITKASLWSTTFDYPEDFTLSEVNPSDL